MRQWIHSYWNRILSSRTYAKDRRNHVVEILYSKSSIGNLLINVGAAPRLLTAELRICADRPIKQCAGRIACQLNIDRLSTANSYRILTRYNGSHRVNNNGNRYQCSITTISAGSYLIGNLAWIQRIIGELLNNWIGYPASSTLNPWSRVYRVRIGGIQYVRT